MSIQCHVCRRTVTSDNVRRREVQLSRSTGLRTGPQYHYGMADVCPSCARKIDQQAKMGWVWAIVVFVVGLAFAGVVLYVINN